MKIKGFNTGRLYASDGQCIKWARLENGVIGFYDRSRMIQGYIEGIPEYVDQAMPQAIMARYDRGEHRIWPRNGEINMMGRDVGEPEDGYGPALRI